MKKSTHEGNKIELFMPIMKRRNGTYMAVLSDNSVDRDEERVSKECIRKLGDDGGYLAALCNHTNDVFMQVAEWTNRGVEEVDGFLALVAEPKFYKSNPNAQIIKGMLDEGAKLGISIGAIVKDYDEVQGMRVYTDLELVEASFVAVPSNRHGRAMAVAKSFNKNKEEFKVEKKYTQEEFDSVVAKSQDELKKQLELKNAEIEKLKKEAEEAEAKVVEEAGAKVAEAEAKVEEAEKKNKEMSEELVKANKVAIEKQKFAEQGGDIKNADEDVDKAFASGKLPVL